MSNKILVFVIAIIAAFGMSRASAQNVGIGNTDPSSTLQVTGSIAGGVRNGISGTVYALTTDYFVTSSGAATYNLPAASTCPGRTLFFSASNGAMQLVHPSGFIFVPGNSNPQTTTTISSSNRAQIISDGFNWIRMY